MSTETAQGISRAIRNKLLQQEKVFSNQNKLLREPKDSGGTKINYSEG